jgi:hypothetical protein
MLRRITFISNPNLRKVRISLRFYDKFIMLVFSNVIRIES